METLTREEFLNKKRYNIKKLLESIFIYPTDTIYGIGCNAEDDDFVQKLRILKRRFDMPFSVIAPSKDWIMRYCIVTEEAKSWIDKLPGPYTLVLGLKNKNAVSKQTNLGRETIGVRIPDNWFSQVVSEMGVPVITTSANVSGQNFMTSLDDLDAAIKKGVDLFIDEGVIQGKPSTLVMLYSNDVEIKER